MLTFSKSTDGIHELSLTTFSQTVFHKEDLILKTFPSLLTKRILINSFGSRYPKIRNATSFGMCTNKLFPFEGNPVSMISNNDLSIFLDCILFSNKENFSSLYQSTL